MVTPWCCLALRTYDMFPPYDATPTRVIAVTPDHLTLAGDGNAALFLAQVLFWWKACGRKKFYKFNAPCKHTLYRAGDSWQEELHLKRTMFSSARQRVATKVRLSCALDVKVAFDQGALIVYGTDENHLTWYLVNEAGLAARSPHLYARLVGRDIKSPGSTSRPAPRATPANPKPTVRTVSSVNPRPNTPECVTSSFPNTDVQHSLMQELDIGLNTEITAKPSPELTSKANLQSSAISLPPPPIATTARVGEGEVHKGASHITKRLIEALQQCGVQSGPARLMAQRALRAGWDATKTLDTFEAHLLDATRAGVRSPVGVAVSRMLDGNTIAPAPRWAERAVQDRKWGQAAKAKEALSRVAQPISVASELTEGRLPLKVLWEQALGDIKLQVTRATFEKHFQGTGLEAQESGYVVRCRTPGSVEWLTHRLSGLVTTSLQRASGRQVAVQFAVK